MAKQLASIVKVAEAAEQLMAAIHKQEAAAESMLEVYGQMVIAINAYCYNHCDHERNKHAPNCPAADMGWPVCKKLPEDGR